MATFIINPAGEIIIEIFRDFKKNYFFVTSNSKEEVNLAFNKEKPRRRCDFKDALPEHEYKGEGAREEKR